MLRFVVTGLDTGAALRGQPPRILASKTVYTTGYWYVRHCQAVQGAQERPGVRSRPFVELPDAMRERALAAVLELPAEIGLLGLRELRPIIAQLRQHHQLNILSIEALAAATRLQANVYLSAPSPQPRTGPSVGEPRGRGAASRDAPTP